jgi:hypothetical protein
MLIHLRAMLLVKLLTKLIYQMLLLLDQKVIIQVELEAVLEERVQEDV